MLAKLRHVSGTWAHLAALVLAVPVTILLITSLLPAALTFEEKLLLLRERSIEWFLRVAGGGSASDNLIFVIQLTWLMWLLAYTAAWFVYRRHQVWGALVPSGAALLLNLFYAGQTDFYLGIYLLSALLLLVRTNLHALEHHWRVTAVGYTSDVQLDVLGYGAFFALMLLLAVWLLPASAPGPTWLAVLDPLQGPWQNIETHFARAFSALRAVSRPAPTAFANATLTMGGPIRPELNPVMDIRAENGRYWRARVYDKYSGGTWFSTLTQPLFLSANDVRLDTPGGYQRVEVTQTVTIYWNDQNILYAQAQPLRFSLPIEARVGIDTRVTPPALDLNVARARRNLRAGDTYTVVSAISVADEESLRADSTDYSEWIRAHYLQLPDDLPARVRAKAHEIAAPFSNPYDRAVALEKFLRAHITYDENVSAPPLGVDGVDYVLFERPAGYCNYYASAMAVMARALGIPARVVSGYALGEYANGVFHIVEANAHSWVEIYFPTYGWIEFEPTASKPEIERPKRPATAPENRDVDEAAMEQRRQRERNRADEMEEEDFGVGFTSRVWRWDTRETPLALVGMGALIIGSVLVARHWARARRLARLPFAARVYEEMLERARWLGVREERYATPLERAQAIGHLVPQARDATACIATFYTRERFGARQLDEVERATLMRAWDAWRAVWWHGVARRAVAQIVSPVRQFIERAYITLNRWNNRDNFQSSI
jgi:transglutaminase-like putative cysteine protease